MRTLLVVASALFLTGCATAKPQGTLAGASAIGQERPLYCKHKAGQFCVMPGGAVKVARP